MPASMRPEDFSPGNIDSEHDLMDLEVSGGFNEAGGFLPRKQTWCGVTGCVNGAASMRPEDFSPGNMRSMLWFDHEKQHASMRPEDFSPGNRITTRSLDRYRRWLQ